jgi:hypothetical protein
MSYNLVPNSSKNFTCETCNYNTSRESQFRRHILTAKHQKMTMNGNKVPESSKNYTCKCGNFYKYRQGLYNHRIKCTFITTEPVKNDMNAELFLEIIKENQEFKELIMTQNSQINKLIEREQASITNNNNTNTNSHNTNSNNTQFNIQLFLNETCKNALNFSEFIENIQVSSDDLENNVKLGFVNGISKLIMDNLKQLELTERPIHCTDAKRDTIYIKEEDQWEKDASKVVLEKGIQEITRKNMCKLSEWREDNPEYQDMESELGEQSILMQQNSMAGVKRDEFYPKIIKNIAKETILDKKMILE